MTNNSNNSSNKLVVPSAQAAIDQMKYEIASEQGVTLGADATARQTFSETSSITIRCFSKPTIIKLGILFHVKASRSVLSNKTVRS